MHAYLPCRTGMVLTSVSAAHEYWGEKNLEEHEFDEEEERK